MDADRGAPAAHAASREKGTQPAARMANLKTKKLSAGMAWGGFSNMRRIESERRVMRRLTPATLFAFLRVFIGQKP
jgi:hypothetical protein